jgi:hypothetical protein
MIAVSAVSVVLHVIHGAAVACLEPIAEFATIPLVDGRALVDLVIVSVSAAMVHVVTASGFNAFTEALALRIAIAIGSAIPVAITVLVLVL